MLGNCLKSSLSCCTSYYNFCNFCFKGDYEPLEGSSSSSSSPLLDQHEPEVELEEEGNGWVGVGGVGDVRRQHIIIDLPPTGTVGMGIVNIFGGVGGRRYYQQQQQQLQQQATMGITGEEDNFGDGDAGAAGGMRRDDDPETGRQKTFGNRLLRRFMSLNPNSSSSAGSGNSSAAGSRSDPNPKTMKFPGKVGIGKEKKKGIDEIKNSSEDSRRKERTSEEIYLDGILEDAAANMINISEARQYSRYLDLREVRERHKDYDRILKKIDPKVLTKMKKRTKFGSLLTDCDFITKNRLMEFDNRSNNGCVSREDKILLNWALEDLDEIINSMKIEVPVEDVVVPYPILNFSDST